MFQWILMKWEMLSNDVRGVTAVEYAIMLFLIALAVVALGQGFGDTVTGIMEQVEAALGGGGTGS